MGRSLHKQFPLAPRIHNPISGSMAGAALGSRASFNAERIRTSLGVPAAGEIQVSTPGPVAVAPRYQDHGIGTALMNATLDAARATGFPAAFLYGDPHYYPRFGFHDAKHLDVTTTEGDNFPEFMGLELIDDALTGGNLVESSLSDVDPVEVDAFDAGFPARSKRQRSSLT